MEIDYNIPPKLLALGKEKLFAENENIYRMNNEVTRCYFILSGVVKIYIDHENGRRSILDFAGKNDWLGELSLFCNETDVKENRVLQSTKCLEFDLNILRDICKEDAEIAYFFAAYISRKLLSRSYRMSEGLNYPLERRLAAFILQYQEAGRYEISHIDVSEYLGVSYRHVLYVMKQFLSEGILQKEKGKAYLIKDMSGLKELSGE